MGTPRSGLQVVFDDAASQSRDSLFYVVTGFGARGAAIVETTGQSRDRVVGDGEIRFEVVLVNQQNSRLVAVLLVDLAPEVFDGPECIGARAVSDKQVAAGASQVGKFGMRKPIGPCHVPDNELVMYAEVFELEFRGIDLYAYRGQVLVRKLIVDEALDNTGLSDGEVTDDAYLAAYRSHGARIVRSIRA